MFIKNHKSILAGALLGLGLLASTYANANSITYFLDDANWKSLLPDNTSYYAKVTIDDEGVAGLINFTVDINPAFVTSLTAPEFKIDTFAFNVNDSAVLADLKDCNLTGPSTCNDPGDSFQNLNSAWKADVIPPDNNTVTSFGQFDVKLSDSNMPLSTLTFSIAADGDTYLSYADPSHGTPEGGDSNSWFAVHVRGITTGLYFNGTEECSPGTDGCSEVTSAWFGGGDSLTPPSSVVIPVPAAVWLFGSGLLGLVGIARRRKV